MILNCPAIMPIEQHTCTIVDSYRYGKFEIDLPMRQNPMSIPFDRLQRP
jgi:hypothetical protein